MNVNFYLTPTGTIMVSFSFGKHRMRCSTGDKCASTSWDQDRQRATVSAQSDGSELNFKLKRLEAWLYSEHRRQENNGSQVTADSMRTAYLKFMGKEPKQVRSMTLIEFIPKYLETAKTKKGQPYSPHTAIQYVQLEKKLKDFEKTTGCRVDFDTISRDLYDKFVKYLYGKVNKDTSAGVYLKSLKHIMNVALKSGMSTSVEHMKDYFVVFAEDSDQEALSLDEITAIYKKHLDDPYHRYIRDLFVLSCHTGLRYSDWSNYTPDNIIEDGAVLRAFTKKTKELVYIPLHPRAKILLQRVFESVYVMPTATKFDRILKSIVKTCGVNSNRPKTFTYKGVSKSVTLNRGDMISAHSGRRSFVTNASRSGISNDAIMRITGHKTEKVFKQYVRIEKLESAHKLMSEKFFTQ